MGLIFLLVAGGILGWLGAIIARAEDTRGLRLNLVAGILGALIAGLVISPLIGGGDLLGGTYDVGALLTALFGSAFLLLIVNLVLHRDTAR